MTRWLSVSAFLVAATIAVGAQTRPALSVPYTEFKLPNGLNVILHRDASVPVVTVNSAPQLGQLVIHSMTRLSCPSLVVNVSTPIGR